MLEESTTIVDAHSTTRVYTCFESPVSVAVAFLLDAQYLDTVLARGCIVLTKNKYNSPEKCGRRTRPVRGAAPFQCTGMLNMAKYMAPA